MLYHAILIHSLRLSTWYGHPASTCTMYWGAPWYGYTPGQCPSPCYHMPKQKSWLLSIHHTFVPLYIDTRHPVWHLTHHELLALSWNWRCSIRANVQSHVCMQQGRPCQPANPHLIKLLTSQQHMHSTCWAIWSGSSVTSVAGCNVWVCRQCCNRQRSELSVLPLVLSLLQTSCSVSYRFSA